MSGVKLPFSEPVIGSERVAMILQGKESVFEIDTIAPLVDIVNRYCRRNDLPRANIQLG